MSSDELTMEEALSETGIINDRFHTPLLDYPLVEGDVVGATVVDVSLTDVTLRGQKQVERDNTYDSEVGPSERYIHAALMWESDERFNADASKGRVRWDSLAFCKNCLRPLDSTDEVCEHCEVDGFVPTTPSVMMFDETLDFPEEYQHPETPEGLYEAVDVTLLPRT